MKRYLVFAGLDGEVGSITALQQVIAERKPDCLLFAGGVGCEACIGKDTSRPDLTPEQAARYEEFYHWLGNCGVPAAVIPGPFDVPLESFLKIGMNSEVEYGNVHLVEGSIWEAGEAAIVGAGGELTEHHTSVFPRVRLSRTMAEYGLRGLVCSDAGVKIMLLSTPISGRLGGDHGSPLAGELVDSFHPHLAVVGGDTKHRGVERVANSLIVNPGRLRDGSAAWIDWTRPANERVELMDVKAAVGQLG